MIMMDEVKFHNKAIIGVLGGMGPEATLECFKSIIDHTPARTDQEHLHVIVDNNTSIPDRTEAILHDGEDPVPLLRSSAKRLEVAGANFLVIPCNTAHYFIEEIREVIDIPILNMIRATIDELPRNSKAGLLATTGTIETGIYEKYTRETAEILYPDEEYQQMVMNVIYGEKGIKAGYKGSDLTETLIKVANHLKEKGVNSIIAGCTEIRLVLSDSDLDDIELLKPIDIVAEKSVKKAKEIFAS